MLERQCSCQTQALAFARREAFYRSRKYIVRELHLSCQFRGSGFVREVTADIVGPPPGFGWRIRVTGAAIAGRVWMIV